MRCKFLIFLVMLIWFAGCSQKQAQDLRSQQAVAKVNHYTITVDDFNHQVGFLRPVFRSISLIPPAELRLSILDEMINRELLLEEAQKLNIDKDPEFMRQIENFWRLSLIKQLLKYKMAQIEASTTVSDEEIKAEPQTIKEIFFRRKVQKALQAWEDSLKTRAVIRHYYGVLNTIPVDASQGGANGKSK